MECKTVLSEDLVWVVPNDIPPGAKATVLEGDPCKAVYFTVRAKFPTEYKIAPHTHPISEHLTVLSGNFNMGMGEKFDKDAIKPDASWDLFCNACWDGSFCLYGGDRLLPAFATLQCVL
jgi:hypothetical protein